MIIDRIKLGFALIISFQIELLGGWDTMLRALFVMTMLDIITGMFVGMAQKKLSSAAAWRGLAKKFGTFVIVAVAVVLDDLFGTTTLRGMAIGFFIGVEGLSIIENWGRFGLPLPKKLRDVLKELSSPSEGNATLD